MTRRDLNSYQTDSAQSSAPGCCSAYAFPPLVVLLIAVGAVMLAFRSPQRTYAAAAPIAAESSEALSPIFTPEVQHWSVAIARWSAAAGVDPNLAATVMQIESCGDPRALSRSGAIGLFQVMPFHFAAAEQPFGPDVNASRGLAYLARSMDAAHGDARLALAGYNGGIGVIPRAEWYWPAETTRYVHWGTGIYADASSGLESSPRLQEWHSVAGASMCRTAHEHLGLPQ